MSEILESNFIKTESSWFVPRYMYRILFLDHVIEHLACNMDDDVVRRQE